MKKFITLVCIITLCLSACTEKEKPIHIEYSNSKVNGFIRPVLLNEAIFKSVYQLDSKVVLEDMILIGHNEKSKIDSTYKQVDQDSIFDVLYVLFEMEIKRSTMNTSVTVDNYSEYELVFNEDIGSQTRNYSIEIGQSYLLVYLSGETNNIIKHDLTSEQYQQLSKLLDSKFKEE